MRGTGRLVSQVGIEGVGGVESQVGGGLLLDGIPGNVGPEEMLQSAGDAEVEGVAAFGKLDTDNGALAMGGCSARFAFGL